MATKARKAQGFPYNHVNTDGKHTQMIETDNCRVWLSAVDGKADTMVVEHKQNGQWVTLQSFDLPKGQ